jgi:uncharacterized SAM-binding protein YcdF (DUF218 family)
MTLKVLAYFVLPSGFAATLLVLGLLAALWHRTRRASLPLLVTAAFTTLVFSTGIVAAALMSPLEYEYPRLENPADHPRARHIVVLTGWAADDPAMPLTGRLNFSSAYRVLLALELHRDRPDCDVIVSGTRVTAKIMGEALVKLGIPPDRLRLEDQSTDTRESIEFVRKMVGDDEVFLVTSGGHMPRAMAEARRVGLVAVPAPTDHQQPKDWRRASWLPSASSLAVSDLAVHEYIGRLWYRLRG